MAIWPVILVNRVVENKRKNGKNGGPRRRRSTRAIGYKGYMIFWGSGWSQASYFGLSFLWA
jgi:hypothetical protein